MNSEELLLSLAAPFRAAKVGAVKARAAKEEQRQKPIVRLSIARLVAILLLASGFVTPALASSARAGLSENSRHGVSAENGDLASASSRAKSNTASDFEAGLRRNRVGFPPCPKGASAAEGMAGDNVGLMLRREGTEAAASVAHPGRLASESADITQESVIRALRQSGSPEGRAVAKLIKRGKINLDIRDSISSRVRVTQEAGAYYANRSNTVTLIKPKISDPRSAAGFAAHETRHWLQERAGQRFSKLSEFEGFQWQRRVDSRHWLRSDEAVRDLVNTYPAYRDLARIIHEGQKHEGPWCV